MNAARTKSEGPPKVQTKDDRSLGRVGAIAAVGFLIGIVWPRLAGVSLVPEAPVEEERPASAPEEETQPGVVAPEPEVIELTPEDRLAISPVKITSCVSASGKKTTSCDDLAVDDLVHDRLMSLLGCPASTGVFGNLSLGMKLDFAKGKITKVSSGRSTDLPDTTAKELLLCAEKSFATVNLATVPHDFDQYQVFYGLEFKTPEVAAEQKTSITPASGQATVQWGTGIVRKEPEEGASVQARLLTGARVVVTGRMGDWYRIKYDAKGREGWIHGGAIGLLKK